MATYRRTRSTRLLVMALLVTSLVTITADSRGGERGPLAAIGRGGLAVISPLQQGVAGVFRPIGSFFSNIFRAGELAREVERLSQANAELRRQQQEITDLQRENEALQEITQLGETHELDLMAARVIAESPSNYEWMAVIDKGADDGVVQDMAVVAGEGLVGRVVQVSGSAAVVELIIDPDAAVTVRLSSSGERGILVGRRDEDLRLDLVSPETEVRPGEPVVTSGYRLPAGSQGGVYPPGVAVGAVSVVESDPAHIEKRVYVRPYVDFSRLDVVAVVRGSVPDREIRDDQPS